MVTPTAVAVPSSPTLRRRHSWFLGLWTQVYTIGSPVFQAFRLRLNDTTSFPGSLLCKWQIMGLLSLHNQRVNFSNKSFCVSVSIAIATAISYWFCVSGETWLINWTILHLDIYTQEIISNIENPVWRKRFIITLHRVLVQENTGKFWKFDYKPNCKMVF